MRSVSPSALQAMLSRETSEVFLVTMRVMHASFPTIRIVNNTQSIERNDGTYLAFPFSVQLPSEQEDRITEIYVQFDNIDDDILEQIRTIEGRPNVSFEVVLASSPNTVEAGPFNFSIIDAKYDARLVTCSIGMEEDILNQAVPKGDYNPITSPGLYV